MSQTDVDAVVVGAGLGGMAASVALAKAGMSVLLLEQHTVPGGYATSFVRGAYEFETALHELSGVGTDDMPGPTLEALTELGVAQKVEWLHTSELYRSIFPGTDVTLPPGFEPYTETLVEAFPGEAKGIRGFMKLLRELGDENERIREVGTRATMRPGFQLLAPFRYPKVVRYNQLTVDQVLGRYVRDPEARGAICQLWGYFGLPPSQLSFFYFALGLGGYIRFGACYIAGRSQALANAFVTRLEELGGRARMQCGVERITAENGRVTGVVTEHGEEIRARYVLSNTDPMVTCRDLIGRDKVPARFFRQFRAERLAMSTVNVYLALGAPPEQVGLTDHLVFVNRDADMDGQFRLAHQHAPPSAVLLTCYNLIYPEISPPGTTIAVVLAPHMGAAWHDVAPADYLDAKHRLADDILKVAETTFPDIRRYAEHVEVSTPVTNMRYARTPGGSIYGYAPGPGRHTVYRVPPEGPLAGLRFVGAWTQPGGGMEPSMISGLLAVESILERKDGR